MKMQYRIQRLRNMAGEAKRLIGVWAEWDSIRIHWNMASLNPIGGRPYRIIMNSEGRFLGPDMQPAWGMNTLNVPRDYFDVIWDFFGDYLGAFFENVFIHERCQHPHTEVEVEWEGDEEIGWVQQHRCNKCRGYLWGDRDVDRYMDEDLRRPELIHRRPEPYNYNNPYRSRHDFNNEPESDVEYDWRVDLLD